MMLTNAWETVGRIMDFITILIIVGVVVAVYFVSIPIFILALFVIVITIILTGRKRLPPVKAYGKVYFEEVAKENVLVLKPTFAWYLLGGKIMVTKDNLKKEASFEFF